MAFVDHTPEEHLSQAQAFSPANATYLANKIKGARNGRKGTSYETLYAAYSLARTLTNQCLPGEPPQWPCVFDQVPSYVDDLLVETQHAHRYHQLKNVAKITWSSGAHPLQTDFELQKSFSDSRQEPSTMTIAVVSSKEVHEKLIESMPASIGTHTEVEYFPYFDSLNRLVQEFEPLRAVLSELTRVATPELDELEYTLSALARAFMHQPGGGRVSDLLDKAQKGDPGLIRLFPHQTKDVSLDDDFKIVLAQISDFEYGLERGFFSWKYRSDSGVLEYHCLNKQFGKFQRDIVLAKPQTFEELESYLL